MNGQRTHDVFISYKAEEFAEASWVKSVLEENGLTCWLAPASIPGGSSYADEIEDAITNCGVFALVLSQKAQESKWVKKELDMALNCEKVILPFMIENCRLQKAFNYYLTDVQRYNAYASKAGAMDDMIERIHGVLGNTLPRKTVSRPPVDAQQLPAKSKHPLRAALLLLPYLLGLFLPLYLHLAHIGFGLWWRLLYFGWILAGAFYIWNLIETRPRIAAMCFGTLKESDLCGTPDEVFSKVASVFGKKAFLSNACPDGFVSYYRLKRLEFGSWDGKRVNYLKIAFRRAAEYYDPSVFYLHSLSRGGRAVKMLTRQGFVISTPPSCMPPTADYLKKGDLHICLYHKKKQLCGAIVYQCTDSELISHYQGEWNDETVSCK